MAKQRQYRFLPSSVLDSLKNIEMVAKGLVEGSLTGLHRSPFHALAKRQFNGRFGSLLTFDLEDIQACFQFIDRLRVIRRSTNLHDNKSLVIHPASTIFSEYSTEERKMLKVSDTLIRLSAGIEDKDDLVEDINQALKES